MTTDQRHTDLLLIAIRKLEEVTDLIREAVRLKGETITDEDFRDRRIEDVDFGDGTTRIHNVFHMHNLDVDRSATDPGLLTRNGKYVTEKIETVRDLITFSEVDLLRAMNFGRISVNRIKAVLSAHGLMLAKYKNTYPHAHEEQRR